MPVCVFPALSLAACLPDSLMQYSWRISIVSETLQLFIHTFLNAFTDPWHVHTPVTGRKCCLLKLVSHTHTHTHTLTHSASWPVVNLYLFTYVTGCLGWEVQSGWADGDASWTLPSTQAELILIPLFWVHPLCMSCELVVLFPRFRTAHSLENRYILAPPFCFKCFWATTQRTGLLLVFSDTVKRQLEESLLPLYTVFVTHIYFFCLICSQKYFIITIIDKRYTYNWFNFGCFTVDKQ